MISAGCAVHVDTLDISREETDVARRPSIDVLAERIEQIEESRADDSRRLTLELEDIRRRISTGLVDADKIRFQPKVVAAIVCTAITFIVGLYGATYGLRSDVRNILTTMEKQRELDAEKEKLTVEKQKLSDERFQSLRDAVGVIDKRQQLQQIETQELKEMVLKQGVK